MDKGKIKALITVLSESLQGTRSYSFQTWLAFLASLGLTGYGIYSMDIAIERKGFLGMGVLFATGGAFTLAKTVRDIHESQKLEQLGNKGILGGGPEHNAPLISALRGTNSWIIQSWFAFILAVGLTGFGIYHMDLTLEKKGFFAMGLLFVLNSTFNLSKNVRDRTEAQKWLGMLQMNKGELPTLTHEEDEV
eukprot:TRINITY_DN10491_c0_g1_i1.p1 TRINITY_DN10491_c0_g1~~TRINITY_DN10491_c0_g1_i1.p1  ORF type:complete len:192 (+),score=37.97 TRINITY_DN10491_c0_g1_i1:36-611(+)